MTNDRTSTKARGSHFFFTTSWISRFALATVALFAAVCAAGNADEPRLNQGPPASIVPSHRVALPSGETLTVEDGVAILRGVGGVVLAKNARVVRRPDPGGVCPADGFRSVVAEGDGFVVRNQLCSGWFVINEIMTFAPTSGGYRLIRFSAEYIDRRSPESESPPRVLTEAKLGIRRFEDVNPDELYRLLE